MNGLKGKGIVVAGGATGLGAATAERLAKEGTRVIVGDINLEGSRRQCADATHCHALGTSGHPLQRRLPGHSPEHSYD